LRRIEDDRERHKRLREKLWILPAPTSLDAHMKPAVLSLLTTSGNKASSQSPYSPASPAQIRTVVKPTDELDALNKRAVDPIAIEFEQLWEAEVKLIQEDEATQRQPRVGGLTENDWTAMRSEEERCFGSLET
jgi:CTD kinase subunit gamma